MYRLLIADDEGIMRESLSGMIARRFGAAVKIETAKTGREAIEQAEYFRPDIVFMDIQMPGIGGIQALREIRLFHATALFYILSAYDKFDYAKEAIDLRVERYLMKPVTRKTVIEVMEEAIAKVDKTRRERSDQLKVQEKLETIIPVVEKGFVDSMLLGGDDQEAQYYRQLLDVEEENGYVAVFRFGGTPKEARPASSVGISVQAQSFYPDMRSIIKSFVRCILGGAMTDKVVAVVPVKEESLGYEERLQVIGQIGQILERLEERLPLKFRAGIGRLKRMDQIRASYQEAMIALQEDGGRVIHAYDVIPRGFYEDDFPVELEKELFADLSRGALDKMRQKAERFYDWMIRRYPDSRDNIRLKVLEYVLWAEKQAFQEGAVNYGFELRKSYLTEVTDIEDYGRLREWFLRRMSDACRSIMTRRQARSETLVSRAKTYLRENFGRDISLDEVSREVNVSPYYFSKLFKEEAGENFIEYLTRIRIDRAKEMLKDPEMSIKEIGFGVGYADPNYFSRIFKKQTEMTPREYRERWMGTGQKSGEE